MGFMAGRYHGHQGFEDCEPIVRGAVHELEHTDDWDEAMTIAADHLRERPDYYEVLEEAMHENPGGFEPNLLQAAGGAVAMALLPYAIDLATQYPAESKKVLGYAAMVAFPPYGLARAGWAATRGIRGRVKRAFGYQQNGDVPPGWDSFDADDVFGDDAEDPLTTAEPWRKPVFRGVSPGDVVEVAGQKFEVLRVFDDHSLMGQRPGAKRKAFSIWHRGPTVQVHEQKGSWETTLAGPVLYEVPFDRVKVLMRRNGAVSSAIRALAPSLRAVVPNLLKWMVEAYKLTKAGVGRSAVVKWLTENKIGHKLANAIVDAVVSVIADEAASGVRSGGKRIKERVTGRRSEVEANPDDFEPNAPQYDEPARYWVWAAMPQDFDIVEGPYGPYPFVNAKMYARIAATKGNLHRIVTNSRDFKAKSFKIVRIYAAGTGDRIDEE